MNERMNSLLLAHEHIAIIFWLLFFSMYATSVLSVYFYFMFAQYVKTAKRIRLDFGKKAAVSHC